MPSFTGGHVFSQSMFSSILCQTYYNPHLLHVLQVSPLRNQLIRIAYEELTKYFVSIYYLKERAKQPHKPKTVSRAPDPKHSPISNSARRNPSTNRSTTAIYRALRYLMMADSLGQNTAHFSRIFSVANVPCRLGCIDEQLRREELLNTLLLTQHRV